MSTATQAKPAQAAAPIVEIGKPAPKLHATAEQIQAYCDAIEKGLPTSDIFPAKLSDMVRTDAQKEQIKTARRNRKDWCRANKANFIKMIRPKHVELTRAADRATSLSLGFTKTLEVAKRKLARKNKVKA